MQPSALQQHDHGASQDGILSWLTAASARIDGIARMIGPLGGGTRLRTMSGGSELAGARICAPHSGSLYIILRRCLCDVRFTVAQHPRC